MLIKVLAAMSLQFLSGVLGDRLCYYSFLLFFHVGWAFDRVYHLGESGIPELSWAGLSI